MLHRGRAVAVTSWDCTLFAKAHACMLVSVCVRRNDSGSFETPYVARRREPQGGRGLPSESGDLLCSPSFIISCFLLGTVYYVTPWLFVPFVAEICHWVRTNHLVCLGEMNGPTGGGVVFFFVTTHLQSCNNHEWCISCHKCLCFCNNIIGFIGFMSRWKINGQIVAVQSVTRFCALKGALRGRR